ncbi:MAG: hypothetical protein JNL01_11930 [Bdellovibrionales bacterium]|nr:hypothetical protein [Bdellovibrionales bacterium]
MESFSVEQLLEQAELLWKDFEELEEKTLLRLGVLRDLLDSLHAKKSESLARGKREEAAQIAALEARIDLFRNTSKFGSSLKELLDAKETPKKRTRLIPEGLYNFIPKEKLERFDRSWEMTLAAEGAQQGWNFWSLDVCVDVRQLADFQSGLGSALKPNGLILFAEGREQDTTPQSEGDEAIWKGRWYILLKPKFRTPDFRVDSLPGASPKTEATYWRLLFTSRKN